MMQITHEFGAAFRNFRFAMINCRQQVDRSHAGANGLDGFSLRLALCDQGDGSLKGDGRLFLLTKRSQGLTHQILHMRVISLPLQQGVINFMRSLWPVGGDEDGCLAKQRITVLRFRLEGAFRMGHGLVMPSETIVNIGAIDMRFDVIRLQRNGFFKEGQRCLHAFDRQERETTGIYKSRVFRRQFYGAAMAIQPLLRPVKCQQCLAAANQAFSIIRSQRKGAVKSGQGFFRPCQFQQDFTLAEMSGRVIWA